MTLSSHKQDKAERSKHLPLQDVVNMCTYVQAINTYEKQISFFI
ncbi:hypothetical protein OKW21_005947 [Catalinimonas alkaloidigena]|nr:hypothetical protein [Catalinimonas alkaloidigena]